MLQNSLMILSYQNHQLSDFFKVFAATGKMNQNAFERAKMSIIPWASPPTTADERMEQLVSSDLMGRHLILDPEAIDFELDYEVPEELIDAV